MMRRLRDEGCELLAAARSQVDLRDQAAVERWMRQEQPDVVILAAARVGGIQANISRPADFLYDNLAIQTNVMHAAHSIGVGRLVYFGSACMYPRAASQPVAEDALLAGPPEPTNEWYAVAKIAGVKMAQAYRRQYGSPFITIVPTNLFGPGDNFDPESCHVIPGLIRRFDEARVLGREQVEIWGSGTPLREFMYVDDLADACVWLLRHYDSEKPINVGTGVETSIRQLAEEVAEVVGYRGRLCFDLSKPDGTPRKSLDSSCLAALGWKPRHGLRDGLKATYDWYRENRAAASAASAE